LQILNKRNISLFVLWIPFVFIGLAYLLSPDWRIPICILLFFCIIWNIISYFNLDQFEQNMVRSLVIFWIPYVLFVVEFLLAPGWFIPFFNHPIGRLLLLAGLIWHIIGCLIWFQVKRSLTSWLVVLSFTGPVILLSLLASALYLLISPGFGPVWGR